MFFIRKCLDKIVKENIFLSKIYQGIFLINNILFEDLIENVYLIKRWYVWEWRASADVGMCVNVKTYVEGKQFSLDIRCYK